MRLGSWRWPLGETRYFMALQLPWTLQLQEPPESEALATNKMLGCYVVTLVVL